MTFLPTSTTSGASLVPASWLIASISSWLLPCGLAEFTLMPGYFALKAGMISPQLAQSSGSAMTLSAPSALAAAYRLSMPPQSATDVAVFALQEAGADEVPPQAATNTNAMAARPSWRTGLLNFILLPLFYRQSRNSGPMVGPARPTLQGWMLKLLSRNR